MVRAFTLLQKVFFMLGFFLAVVFWGLVFGVGFGRPFLLGFFVRFVFFNLNTMYIYIHF